MGEPREIRVYERYDDPTTESALFDFRPHQRPADAPDVAVPGLDDITMGDITVGPTPEELKSIEEEEEEEEAVPKENGSLTS